MSESSKFSADEILRLFFTAPSEAESAKFLSLLVEKHALPTVEKILRAKFGTAPNGDVFSASSYEDLRGECGLKIVGVLRTRKNAPNDAPPIADFTAYAAAIAYNVWNAFVRENSPNRESLKNKIRYALDKDRRFAGQKDADGASCYGWRTSNFKRSVRSAEQLATFLKENGEFFGSKNLPDLLAAIFERADGNLPIETLVAVVADLWQVRDFPAVSLDDFHERAVPETRRGADWEMRCQLEYLWREIRALPVFQRAALLYNLRDERGGEMLLAFFNTRIAELAELAEALNLTKTQFAELLPRLPFDDRKIAAAMNLSVKQVGNLRKAARDNLRRRLDGKTKRRSAARATEIYTFIGDDEEGAETAGKFLN